MMRAAIEANNIIENSLEVNYCANNPAATKTHVNILAALLGMVRRQSRVVMVAAHAERIQPPRLLHHLQQDACCWMRVQATK